MVTTVCTRSCSPVIYGAKEWNSILCCENANSAHLPLHTVLSSVLTSDWCGVKCGLPLLHVSPKPSLSLDLYTSCSVAHCSCPHCWNTIVLHSILYFIDQMPRLLLRKMQQWRCWEMSHDCSPHSQGWLCNVHIWLGISLCEKIMFEKSHGEPGEGLFALLGGQISACDLVQRLFKSGVY